MASVLPPSSPSSAVTSKEAMLWPAGAVTVTFWVIVAPEVTVT